MKNTLLSLLVFMSGSVLCNDPLVITEQMYSCAVSNSMPKHGFAERPIISIIPIHSSDPEGNSYWLHQYPDRSVFFSTGNSQSFVCRKGLEQKGAAHLIVLQAIDENRLDRSEPSPTSSPEAETSGTGKPEESRGLPGSLNIKTFQHLVDSPTPSRPVIGAITASMESQSIFPMPHQEATQIPETPSLVGLDLSLDLSLQHLLMLLLLGGPDMAEAFSLSRSQLMNASPLELTTLAEKLEEYLLPGQLLTDHYQNTTEDLHFTRLIQTLMQRLQSIQTLASRLSGGENISPQLQRIRRDRLAVLQADFAGQIAIVQHSIQAGNDPALLLLDSIQALHEAEHSSDNFLPTETYLHDSVEILTLDVLTQKQDHVLEQIKRHDNARPGDLWNILANRLMVLEVETAQILAETIAKTIPPVRTTPHGRKRGSPPSDPPQEDSDREQARDNGNAGNPGENSASGEAAGGGEQPPEQKKNQENPLPNDGTRDFNAELLSAVTNNDLKTAHWCLDQGADINATNSKGATALIIAAQDGYIDIVNLLLKRGATIENHKKNGVTALMTAVRYGYTDIVNSLLNYKASTVCVDKRGWTPLIIAARRRDRTEIVKTLLKHKAATDVVDLNDCTALMHAARKGRTDIVKTLLKHKAATDVVDLNGCTALMHAVRKGRTDIAKTLLKHKAATDVVDLNGCTALMIAASEGRTDIVKTLLKHKAATDVVDLDGCTALIHAACGGRTDIIETLLKHKAATDVVDQNGWTALMLAAKYGHNKIVKILLEGGANIECATHSGETNLMIAAQHDHTKIIKILLEEGANIESVNKSGETALFFAATFGKTKAFITLLEHKAKTDLLIESDFLMSRIREKRYIKISSLLYAEAFKNSPARYCKLLHETAFISGYRPHRENYALLIAVFNKEALTRTGQFGSFPLHLKAAMESPERYLEFIQLGPNSKTGDKEDSPIEEKDISERRQELKRWCDQTINSMDELFLNEIWMLEFLTLKDLADIRQWLLRHEAQLQTARWHGLSLLHLVILQNRPDLLSSLLFILKDLSPKPNGQSQTPLYFARRAGNEEMRDILEPAVLQSKGWPKHLVSCCQFCHFYPEISSCASPPTVFSLQSLASNALRRSGESLDSLFERLKDAPPLLTRIIFAQPPPEDSSGEED